MLLLKVNKTSHKVIVILACIFLAIDLMAQPEDVLIDLETAQKKARENSYDILTLRAEVEEAKARRMKIDAAFLPKVGVAAGVEQENSKEINRTSPVGYIFGTYNIYNGGRDSYHADIADSQLQRGDLKLKQAYFDLNLQVEEAYFDLVFKKELIALKTVEIDLNQKHQLLVRQTKLRGSVSDTDVMEFELKDALLHSDLRHLQKEFDQSSADFSRLLVYENNSRLSPKDSFDPERTEIMGLDTVSQLTENSPTLMMKTIELSIAKNEANVSEARWLPEIMMEGHVGYFESTGTSESTKPQAKLSIVAKMDLYTGGETQSERLEKSANLLKAEYQLKSERMSARKRTEAAYVNMKSLKESLVKEKATFDLANRYYSSVLEEYKRGYKNSSDLREAGDQLHEIKSRKLSLYLNFIRSRIDLEKTLGFGIGVASKTNSTTDGYSNGKSQK